MRDPINIIQIEFVTSAILDFREILRHSKESKFSWNLKFVFRHNFWGFNPVIDKEKCAKTILFCKY
jgi:hypothetical protein